jgi:hypothetical protein
VANFIVYLRRCCDDVPRDVFPVSGRGGMLSLVFSIQVLKDPSAGNVPRKEWDAWDPMLISEGLFSAANIFR